MSKAPTPAIATPPVPSQTYLHHTTLAPRPKLILIGDSITEQGSATSNGWVTSLSIHYNRRVDVINRGMNGYNSRWGKAALPFILQEILGSHDSSDGYAMSSCVDNGQCTQEKHQHKEETTASILYSQYTFLIGYGANDSCLPDGTCSRHHVPLDEYSSNLKQMIEMIQSYNDNYTRSSVSVALLTPPPCDTDIMKQRRDNENVTRLYASQIDKVGNEMKVPVVDLWNGMQLPIQSSDVISNAEGDYDTKWKQDYLSDGLHLTSLGNYRLYQLVVDVLEKSLGLLVQNIPRQFPDHSMVDAENPDTTFGTNTVN
eukprot:scaffold90174_cov65-Cyclotella_meneghiniana.AAC.4